jgi:phosphatidylglycerophosphate synthase
MPGGQERGRERSDARFGSSSLDIILQFVAKCSGSPSPGLRHPLSPAHPSGAIKGEGVIAIGYYLLMGKDDNRRPIAARASSWARALSASLARSSITPNQISVISIFFAAVGAMMLAWGISPWGLLLAAVCVQLRLLCNLLDGMIAVEGGKQTPTGALYNEFPDRIADSLLIVALGYAALHPWLGWLGALLAALTAYIRIFGGSSGLAQDFRGPMAKPHRMAVLTVACLLGAAELRWNGTRHCLLLAAALIAAGSALTCYTRIRAIAGQLNQKG